MAKQSTAPKPGSAAWNQAWIAAFKKAHGGLSPEEYDYLQSLYKQKQAAPAPAPAAPPRLAPFLTPEQTIDRAQFDYSLATDEAGVRRQLTDLTTDTNYQKAQLDEVWKHNTGATNDDAAARGIFQSSIRDAALDDLKRTRDTAKSLLDTKLHTANIDANDQIKRIGDLRRTRDAQQPAMAAQNAAAAQERVNQNMPAPAPAAPAPAAPAAPAPNRLQQLINQYGGQNVKLKANGLFYRRPSDGKWIPA